MYFDDSIASDKLLWLLFEQKDTWLDYTMHLLPRPYYSQIRSQIHSQAQPGTQLACASREPHRSPDTSLRHCTTRLEREGTEIDAIKSRLSI
jgi:hypothetical protein